jgi:FKBP-type peptidyl-prolyl cis-trans isomerase FklB
MKRILIPSTLLAILAINLNAADPAPSAKSEQKVVEVKVEPKTDAAKSDKKEENYTGQDLKLDPGKTGLAPNTNKIVFTNLNQKASYVMGVQNAATMAMDGAELLDVDMIVQGIRDVFERRMPLVSQEEAEDIMNKFREKVLEADAERKKKEAQENKEKGIKFLEENAKKDGVKTTDSGLQYKVVQEGKGDSPTEDDRVLIHFRARNVDNIEFSNSYKHKTPIPTFVRSQIKAFREALVMMKKGAKWELYVPSELAYGQREVGKGVGPNSALIFELELVDIEKPKADSGKKTDAAAKK